jgi:hypothetical protein
MGVDGATLYTLNTTTGAATPVDPTTVSGITGGDIAIPEPACTVPLALLLLTCRRKSSSSN